MDGLIERLRERVRTLKFGDHTYSLTVTANDPMRLEAAAEIERLKVALDDHYDSAWDKIALLTKSLGEMTKERDELRGQVEALRVDALRYRWLRLQHWDEADVACVKRPKDAVKLGHDCPSLERLDAAIDAARRAPVENMRADAERYRWLRDDGTPELCVVSKATMPLYDSQLDAAIDVTQP